MLWQRAGYIPGHYRGNTQLIVARDSMFGPKSRTEQAWRQLAPKSTVRTVSGDHESCVIDHLDEFLRTIELAIDQSTTGERQQQ